MKKTIMIIAIIIALILITLTAARLITGEDTWICVGGEWIKHGFPSSPKPIIPCD